MGQSASIHPPAKPRAKRPGPRRFMSKCFESKASRHSSVTIVSGSSKTSFHAGSTVESERKVGTAASVDSQRWKSAAEPGASPESASTALLDAVFSGEDELAQTSVSHEEDSRERTLPPLKQWIHHDARAAAGGKLRPLRTRKAHSIRAESVHELAEFNKARHLESLHEKDRSVYVPRGSMLHLPTNLRYVRRCVHQELSCKSS
eukprot:scaffold336_cov250-Pinguiococcus_pyrenoidosus.AAC.20